MQLELKLKAMTWWTRVTLSFVGICVVDAYFVFKSSECNESIRHRDFYFELAYQRIDSDFDSVGLRGGKMIATVGVVYNEGELTSGVDII
jgi:hypothetical protein